MGKIRVHELAKELGKSSGDVIAILEGMGITDAKPASGIDESAAAKVREKLSARKEGTVKENPAKENTAKAPEGEEAAPKKKK